MQFRTIVASLLWLLFTTTNTSLGGEIFFAGMGDLRGGGISSNALGISGDGRFVVGDSQSSIGQESARWFQGTLLGMGNPGIWSSAAAASFDGSVIVGANHTQPFRDAYRWTLATGMTSLGTLPGGFRLFTDAWDVSADGSVVVGRAINSIGEDEAFRWTAKTGMLGLGDLPGGTIDGGATGVSADGRVAVGWSHGEEGREAFRWENGVMSGLGSLPGAARGSFAQDVSSDGTTVIGNASVLGGAGVEAFRWTAATGMVGLGDLPGGDFGSEGNAISADGSVIVGRSLVRTVVNPWEAFIWDEAHGMRNLPELFEELGLNTAGWKIDEARAVSDDGRTIVGTGFDPSGHFSGWIARIPEPSAACLFALVALLRRPR